MDYYCSICNSSITQAEAKYSKNKFNKYLCRKHQSTDKISTPVPKKPAFNKGKKDNSWVYNLIKGRIAETIIEQLFLNLNFHPK